MMENTSVQNEHPVTRLMAIACELITEHDGNRIVVLAELERRIFDDPELCRWAVHEGARSALIDAMRITRLSKLETAGVKQMKRIMELTPLKFWRLENGTLLRAANKRQLIEAAESLERVAAGMLSRAILYRRIAARLKTDDELVELRISDDELKTEMQISEGLAQQAVIIR